MKNALFAVYGQHAQAAMRHIDQHFQSVVDNTKRAFVTTYNNNYCVLGNVSVISDQASSSAGMPKNSSSATSGPLIIYSRMSVYALLKCNFDAIGCSSLHDLSTIFQEASASHRSSTNLKKTLAKLNGDFTCIFVTEHAQEQTLVLAVSAFNPQTLFYACLRDYENSYENTYVVCSDLSLLLELLPPKVDTGALSMWLAGRPDPNRSMFANIHQVPQASMLSMSLSDAKSLQQKTIHCQLEKFWDITPQSLNELSVALEGQDKTQLIATLQAHLQSSVATSLLSDGNFPVFTQLSGGMDSTTVSAMAFNTLKKYSVNTALHSISHTYANTQSCDETDNIQAMLERYPFAQSHFIELDKYTELSFAELYPTHPQSPGMVLSPKYHEEAKLLKAFGSQLLLTGNGGDEMFWGHSFAYYDRLKSADITVVGEVINAAQALNLSRWQSLKSVFLSPMLHYYIMPMLQFASKANTLVERSLHIPPWLTQQSEAMVREHQHAMAKANPFASGKHGLTRYARYEGLFNTSTFNSMRSYQAVFDQYDLQVQHPLFDKHIAEFSFAVDQHNHISGKYPKLLLRQAMNEHLPEQVCWNKHKTVFDQHFAKLVQQNQHALRKLLAHEGLANLGLVNNKKLLATFDAVVTASKPSLNVDLLYAILVQSWYQTHILKLSW